MTREGIVNLIVSLASLVAIGSGVALYDYRAGLIAVGVAALALTLATNLHGGTKE